MSRPIVKIELDAVQRRELCRVVKSPTSPQRDVLRARVVLLKAEGKSQASVAETLGIRRSTVGKWCGRFAAHGMAGLSDAKGRGRPDSIPAEKKALVITGAVRPPPNRSRWSVRAMAEHAGVSPGTVHRLWRSNDIKPHIVRTFKLSNDRHFERKFWDVIGLYLDPPREALVFCCDEKSQCQALERTQPGLPLGIGHVRTKTHDYTRHGTVTLFAALNYLDGTIISRTAQGHAHGEWLAFLRQIDRETAPGLDLHLIADNYATHKHKAVTGWLARHPRIHLHFTPTSSSWMNLVERFFRDLTEDVVREGSFNSVKQLVAAMDGYLAGRNLSPRRYVWKKQGAEILAKIQKARAKLETAAQN